MPHATSESMVRWMADTAHRAYHRNLDGHFTECPRDICSSATKHLYALEQERRQDAENRCPQCQGRGEILVEEQADSRTMEVCWRCLGAGVQS